VSSRKLKRNFGFETASGIEPAFKRAPLLSETRVSVLMPERTLKRVIEAEVERLLSDETELVRFFSHFFDPTIEVSERDSFVAHFKMQPPTVTLGYARAGQDFPVIAIVLQNESEEQEAIGQYMGESLEGEDGEAANFVGSIFQSTWSIYVYAQNPDACLYIYNLTKSIVIGAKQYLIQGGLYDPQISGEELAPAGEEYLPENMFVRALRVTAMHQVTVPVLQAADPGKMRISGLFQSDITVDESPGAVRTYVGNNGNEESED